MASRNQKFSVQARHAQALFALARATHRTPTECLARLLDAALPLALESYGELTQRSEHG